MIHDRDPLADERCMHGYLQGIGCAACHRTSRRIEVAAALLLATILLLVVAVVWQLRGGS
jgi:hypothetical protein